MLTYACYPTPFWLKLCNQLELGLRDWNFFPYPTHPKFLCGAYSLLACCGALRPFPPKLCGMGSLSFHAGFPPIYMGACGALWTHVCLSLGRFRPLKSFHAARSCLESSLFGVGGGKAWRVWWLSLIALFKLFGEGREGLREVPLSCCLNWGEIPTTSPFIRTLPSPKPWSGFGRSQGGPTFTRMCGTSSHAGKHYRGSSVCAWLILRLGPSLELFGLSWGVSLAVLLAYPIRSNSGDGWDFPNDPSLYSR